MASDAGGGGGGFPHALFTIEDDPAKVRSSAAGYLPMQRQAQATYDTLGALTVDSWQGSEGDLFRTRRAAYQPMMSVAARVFGDFVTAVEGFADTLADLRRRMEDLRVHAEGIWKRLQAAEAAQASAAASLTSAVAAAATTSPTGMALAASTLASAETAYGDAVVAVNALRAAWEEDVRQARKLHTDLGHAADTAAAVIRGLEAPPTVPGASGADAADGPSIDINAALRSGLSVPTPPKPIDTMSAAEVRTWWSSLDPTQRSALARTDPEKWGRVPGIPAADRDVINRLTLEKELLTGREIFTRAGRPVPTTPEEIANLSEADLVALGVRTQRFTVRDAASYTEPNPQQVVDLERFKAALAVKVDLEKNPPGKQSSSFLYTYQPGLYEGRGRTLIAVGNPEAADNVAVVVPGLTSRTSSMGGMLNDARKLQKSAKRVDGGATTSVLVWQGYDAPQLDGGPPEDVGSRTAVIGEGKADAGAKILAEDVAALRSSRTGTGVLSVVAHSYGSTTAGLAAQRYGLSRSVDTLSLIGSPGPGQGAHTVADLHLRHDQVFIGSASKDVVTAVGGATGGLAHGSDPAMEDFGATRFRAESVDRSWHPGIADHLRYLYDQGESESRSALADIITGHGDRLGPDGLLAEGRRVETYGEAAVIVDPEAARTPQRVAPTAVTP